MLVSMVEEIVALAMSVLTDVGKQRKALVGSE